MQSKKHKTIYRYKVYPNGKIINKEGETMKCFPRKDGYVRVNLLTPEGRKCFLLHRILAHCFLKLKVGSKLTVNHKNGIKNDNRLKNLEVITQSQNNIHSRQYGFRENKLSNKDVKDIHHFYFNGNWTQKELSRTFGVSQTFISKIINKKQMSYAV